MHFNSYYILENIIYFSKSFEKIIILQVNENNIKLNINTLGGTR